MKASEVMTRRVVSIGPEATIFQAIKLMMKRHFSGLPVVDRGGKLVGIITEGDFMHRREIGTEQTPNAWLVAMFGPDQSARDYVRAHGLRVSDLMTARLLTVDENTPLDRIVRIFEQHHIKRVPVLREGKLVGIISRADILKIVASVYRSSPRESPSDRELRGRIAADIEDQNWAYGADVLVLVRDGIVDLCGTLSDPAQREAITTLVREKAGVRKLNDHLQLKNGVVSVT